MLDFEFEPHLSSTTAGMPVQVTFTRGSPPWMASKRSGARDSRIAGAPAGASQPISKLVPDNSMRRRNRYFEVSAVLFGLAMVIEFICWLAGRA